MSSAEFAIIEQFFKKDQDSLSGCIVGIGDDCAIINVPKNMQLAVSTDTLVEGVHFLPDTEPESLGHKVLAVNLSDLAAMGAKPAWVSMAITLPSINKEWLSKFTAGFFALASQHGVNLIGGDTTQGPLSITISIMGLLPVGQRLLRSGAKVGDSIYVSGTIGSAGLGLVKAKEAASHDEGVDLLSYLKPVPQISLGQQLLKSASACIDVSDGLSADLNHILKASAVGARLDHDLLPINESVREHARQLGDELWPYSTGDDYELCFTLPKQLSQEAMRSLSDFNITKIGVVEREQGLRIEMKDGQLISMAKGYEHFEK